MPGSLLNTVQTLVMIAAVVVGGIWTYLLFVVRRQKYPRAELSHVVDSVEIRSGTRLVHVAVKVTNVGDVLLRLVSGCTRLQQIAPLADEQIERSIVDGVDPVGQGKTEVEWPLLGERQYSWSQGTVEVEPGESDTFHCDFVTSTDVRVVEIYTHLENESKKKHELGWCQTTVVDLDRSA